jgi:DNA-binding YbaB/EbfC family protein
MDLLKNASEANKKLTDMTESLAGIEATGSSGGNMVRITLNGKFEMLDIELDPIAVDNRDIPMLQDLIIAAFGDAQARVMEEMRQKLGPAFGAFNIPGITP